MIRLALPEMKSARVQIEIDPQKCTTPMACRKCLEVCPELVFQAMVVKEEKFKETDINESGAYTIIPVSRWKCIQCNLCVDACPVGAIKITAIKGG